MARQNGMSTPIFDQLLREMAEHAQASTPTAEPAAEEADADPLDAVRTGPPGPRRRHRAD